MSDILELTIEEGLALKQLIQFMEQNEKDMKASSFGQELISLVRRKTGKDISITAGLKPVKKLLLASQSGKIKQTKMEIITDLYDPFKAMNLFKQLKMEDM